MATLVLTAAGTMIGGPLGGAIGAALGQAVDRELLFKPKGREGPRLNELRVQTSSYGTQIPKLFGTMRVAGSVIWATDLVEHRSTSHAKGQPSATSYSYTVSFAVALSSRPILGVGRIWAEGKLLRGAAGDFKTRTGFRLHLGHEDQAADPLIVAAEGAALAPAHRGIAYAVFENLELADFGNRIPSLTFEVVADSGAVNVGAILSEIGGGDFAPGDAGVVLAGFSAHGSSVRAVAEPLTEAAGGWFRTEGSRLALVCGAGPSVAVEDLDAREGARESRAARAIAAADSAPRLMIVSHYDPARDYQAGVQRAVRPGAGRREARLELPAAIDGATAKTMAESALARREMERERRTIALPWRRIGLEPGARLTIAGMPGAWRVDRWSLEKMVLTLECVSIAPAAMPATASSGRVSAAQDSEAGRTQVHAFELPPLDGVAATAPRIGIAAAGTADGWRRAALLMSTDGGATWASAGATAAPATLGRLIGSIGFAPAQIEDRRNAAIVELAHAAMMLGDADAAALAGGANLAMLGEELIQFGRAEPVGGNRWRLSRLWRGRRGTESAVGMQADGAPFTLVTRDTMATLDLPSSAIGATLRILASGSGDPDAPAEAGCEVSARSLRPPAPAQLRAVSAGGTTLVRWVRRSRTGWDWIDGVDAPLGEERERYRVTLAGPDWVRTEDVGEAVLSIPAADRTAGLTVTVQQAGSHGLSLPAVLHLPPLEES